MAGSATRKRQRAIWTTMATAKRQRQILEPTMDRSKRSFDTITEAARVNTICYRIWMFSKEETSVTLTSPFSNHGAVRRKTRTRRRLCDLESRPPRGAGWRNYSRIVSNEGAGQETKSNYRRKTFNAGSRRYRN